MVRLVINFVIMVLFFSYVNSEAAKFNYSSKHRIF